MGKARKSAPAKTKTSTNTKTSAMKQASAKTKAPAKVAAPAKIAAPAKAAAAAKGPTSSKVTSPVKPQPKQATRAKSPAAARTSRIILAEGYRPSEDEPFMNARHKAYFRAKLEAWRDEIVRQTRETLEGLHEDSTQHADLADRATSETDRALELRARDRQRKLVAKIDQALARIEDGTYGYCEETGEPIGLRRLDARPIATLSVEAQERHERRERIYRED